MENHGYIYHAVEVDKAGRCVEVHYSGEYSQAANFGRFGGLKKICPCCERSIHVETVVIAGEKPKKGEQILKIQGK